MHTDYQERTTFINEGAIDDNEHGAGRTVYFIMEENDIYNRAIFLVRHYGNKHLGPARFQAMKDAVRSVIKWSPFNKVRKEIQRTSDIYGGDSDSEISFRKNVAASKGYASAASPRPFAAKNGNWGSTESMAHPENMPVSSNLRPRANSIDSTASFSSFHSQSEPVLRT